MKPSKISEGWLSITNRDLLAVRRVELSLYRYFVSSQKVGAILPNPKGFENL
jgi:hypothetical protein